MKSTIKMMVWVAIAAAWVALTIISSNPWYVSNILINAWCIVIFISLIAMKRKERRIRDERLVKISAYSYSYSWMITFLMIWIISWLNEANIVNFTLWRALLTLLFTMSISYIIVYIVFNYRWDVN